MNADLSLRRKLNQKLKPTKKTKKTDKTTSSAQNEKKKGGQKTQTKPNKKKPKKPRKVHVHDGEAEENAGDCHDEEVSNDDDTKKKDKTKKKNPPEKKTVQPCPSPEVEQGQKTTINFIFKYQDRGEEGFFAYNLVPKVRARGKTSPETEKKKRHHEQEQDEPPAPSSSRLKEEKEENADGEGMESRVKQHHRITSRAYHQTFDSLKPKIKDGFTKGSAPRSGMKQWSMQNQRREKQAENQVRALIWRIPRIRRT